MVGSNPKLAEEVDGLGDTALYRAAIDPKFPPALLVELMAAWPGAAAHTTNYGSLPLHNAAVYGRLPPDRYRFLLEAHLAGVRAKDKVGDTPLVIAIRNGAPEASIALMRAATQVTSPALPPTRHHTTPQSRFHNNGDNARAPSPSPSPVGVMGLVAPLASA